MAIKQKLSEITARVLHILNQNAIWLTLFVSIILLLVFYQDFLLNTSYQKLDYLPLQNYLPIEKIPLWNSQINSGMPIWGNPENISHINIIDSALFSLLEFAKPYVPDVHFLYLVLNLLMFSGFTFGFLRRISIRPIVAFLVAIWALFIPQYVINIVDGQWTNILALALMPAVLYFTQLLLEQRKLLWLVLGAFFFAFQLLRASAAVTLSTLGFILIIYLVYSLHWRVKSKVRSFMSRGGLCLGMLVLGFAMASYIYMPFIEFAQYVIFQDSRTAFSFKDFFAYIYPSFNGPLFTQDARFVLYFSVVIIFLAGFALLLRRSWRTYLLFAACVLCLVVAFLGYWGPTVYGLPIIALFLSGIGVNALLKYRKKIETAPRSRWLDVYMLIMWSLFTAGFVILFLNKPGYMNYILKQLPLLTIANQQIYYRKVLIEAASAFVLIGLVFFFIRLHLSNTLHMALFMAILGVLTLADLWRVDYQLMDTRRNPAPTLPETIMYEFDNNESRFRVFSTTNHSLENYASVLGDSRSVLKYYDAFLRSTGLGEKDEAGMRNPFFSKYTRLVTRGDNIVEEPIPVDYIDPALLHFDRTMLDLLNVKYIVSYSPIHDPNYFVLHDSSFFVYKNTSVLPRAFFVDSVTVLPGRRAIFDAMQTKDFYPRDIAFLEQAPPFQVYKADSNVVTIQSSQHGRINLTVTAKQATALMLSEVYYPAGWKAFVDGQKTDIYKTNYFLRSIFLKPGLHKVKLEFMPALFRFGVWISVTSFSLCFTGFIAGLIFYIQGKPKKNMGTK